MEETKLPIVKIFSDGSALNNPGKGGFGTIVKQMDVTGEKVISVKEFAQGFIFTTNNRMELSGAIAGFESLKTPCQVTLVIDSKYLLDAFKSHWIDNWKNNGWKTASGGQVKNIDLWKRLDYVMQPHKVKMEWVKGHAGHPENERCDYLARTFASGVVLEKGDDGTYKNPDNDD